MDFHTEFRSLMDKGECFLSVILVETRGSTPQDAGSKMLVTTEGLFYGTVGGGKIEKKALEDSQELLKSPSKKNLFRTYNLQKDIGMTCGGSVSLYFEKYNELTWPVVIFGAGHVSQAVCRILTTVNCQVTCYDTRKEWLDKLPTQITTCQVSSLPERVAALPEKAFVLLMTHGHSSDAPILIEALANKQFAYLGVIGSKSKRAALIRELEQAEIEPEVRENFFCPIGLPIGSNHPGEIAISIVAQLLQVRGK